MIKFHISQVINKFEFLIMHWLNVDQLKASVDNSSS